MGARNRASGSHMTCFTIYLHRNRINGKSYVGQTKKTIEERWKEHLKCAKGTRVIKNARGFTGAIRKYGAASFEHRAVRIRNIRLGQRARRERMAEGS